MPKNKKDQKIHIVGAGISGLIAAKVLEDHGFSPILLESTERVGGRVKTEIVNGICLDRGFQVLLTAYPAARKYLDFKKLELQKFLPGAAIFINGKQHIIGDPLRKRFLLLPTLFSEIGTFSDKLTVFKLNMRLKKKTISQIFSEKEQTTLAYLEDLGFSQGMISQFFRPFFSGIFLETELETSSRMFEFIYKMFGEGYAAIPKSGIESIPKQLRENLHKTTIKFNTSVSSVKEGEILLSSGDKLESDFTIMATEASKLIKGISKQSVRWRSCDTLYFMTDKRVISKSLIGLVTVKNALVNNIFYHSSFYSGQDEGKQVLSVTVVQKHNFTHEELIKQVKRELKEHCGIEGCAFVKRFSIPMSLPQLTNLQYDMLPSETRLSNTIFLAGDTQLNASLNAAMISGERAALGLIDTFLNLR